MFDWFLKSELDDFGIQLIMQSHKLKMGEKSQGYPIALVTRILSILFGLSDSLVFDSLLTESCYFMRNPIPLWIAFYL